MSKMQRPTPIDRGGPQEILYYRKTKAQARTDRLSMCATTMLCLSDSTSSYASPFFFTVLFGLAGASALTGSPIFFEAALFNFAFIAFLFLELPKEPIAIFPFFDFLSPFPMFSKNFTPQL
jgi:hypothetical protein